MCTKQKNNIKSINSKKAAMSRWQRLRWTQPHGATGLVSLVLGHYLMGCAVRGNLEPYYSERGRILVILYVASTILNGVFGYRLTGSSKSNASRMFRRTAVLQCLLCYYILRFLPFQVWDTTTTASNTAKRNLVLTLDTVCALLIPLPILSIALRPTRGETPAIDLAGIVGACALMLVAVYPIQLALGGWGIFLQGSAAAAAATGDDDDEIPDYWACLQERYPVQGVAMSAFIYLPATVCFSVCIFGATLYERGIVSAVTFGAFMVGSALTSLVTTVLSQELHVPYVSTQRIYLPCIEPAEGSLEALVVTALDFSLASRYVLTWMGFDIPAPPE